MISENIKKQIIDFADGYGAVITFRDEMQVSQKDITINWSNGEKSNYSVWVDPVMINDNNTIQVNAKLTSNKVKSIPSF